MKKVIFIITALLCVGAAVKFQQSDKQEVKQQVSKKSKPMTRERAASPATPKKLTYDDDVEMVLLPASKPKKVVMPTKFSKNSITPEQAMDQSFEEGLKAKVTSALQGKSPKEVAELLSKDKDLHRELLQWRLLHGASSTEDELLKRRVNQKEAIKKAEESLAAAKAGHTTPATIARQERDLARMRELAELPTSFKELFADKNQAAVFRAMSGDADFLKNMFYSGEPTPTVRTMNIFGLIAKTDSDVLKKGRSRDIAQGLALEYSRNNWSSSVAVERGEFFLQMYEAGRLHSAVDKVPMPLVRLLVGAKGNHNSTSVSSMKEAVETAHMPSQYYNGFKGQTAICWRAGWRRHNLLGDSIHGPNYYMPYNDFYDENHALRTVEIGGVCGDVSSMGTCYAIGNGIPAMTMGEPGHCAYTVLVGDKWMPAYSLSWKRGLHWQHWDKVNHFSSLQQVYDMYDAKQSDRSNKALSLGLAAECMRDSDPKAASALYKAATDLQPLAYPLYRDYLDLLKDKPQGDAAEVLLQDMCQNLAKSYPENAAFILQNHGMPLLKDADAKTRISILADFWKACTAEAVAPWDTAAYFTKQAEWVGQADGDGKSNIISFYGRMLAAVITEPTLTPTVMTWAADWASKQDKNTQAALTDMSFKVMKAASSKGISMDTMLAQAIVNAEKMEDLDSFQTLSKMVPEDQRYAKGMPTFEALPGELVSEGGMIRPSSYEAKHDTPLQHAGVLDVKGGFFHTNKEKDANVVIQLPRVSEITGLVLVISPNQPKRLSNMKIQISDTGAENSWVDIHDMGSDVPKRVNTIKLSGKHRGRFVRILRGGDAEFFMMHGIYIYGKRSS